MPEIPVDAFEMQAERSADEMLNCVRTWSATQRCLGQRSADPVALYGKEPGLTWGPDRGDVRWPLTLRVARLPA